MKEIKKRTGKENEWKNAGKNKKCKIEGMIRKKEKENKRKPKCTNEKKRRTERTVKEKMKK